MDLLFCTDKPLDAEIYRVAAMKWAREFANIRVNDLDGGKIQLLYENEDTDVGFTLTESIGDWTDHLSEEKLAELRETIDGATLCDWQFTLNYFRPSFFAREAMPYLAEFALMNSFSILDPESAEIIPAEADELSRWWAKQNKRAIASILFDDEDADMTTYSQALDKDDLPEDDQDSETFVRPYKTASNGLEFTFVDTALLDRCWQYNHIKEKVQSQTDIFVPKVVLLQLTQNQPFCDMFIWTRTVITAVPETEVVLMAWTEEVSEDAEFQHAIARGKDLKKTIKAQKAKWSEQDGYLMPPLDDDPVQASVDLFDLCWQSIVKPHDPKKCAMLGGFMCVVETELVNELAADVSKH